MGTPTTILDRLLQPDQGTFSAEHARFVLSLGFSEAEQERCEELSYKAQEGALSEDERRELELFLNVNSILIMLKSKARRSLGQRPSAA